MNPDLIESRYPQSPMQQGMLFHVLHEQQPSMYFEQFICTLEGPLESERLRQACQQVVNRHPVLRTAFSWEDPESPLQIVWRQIALPWRELDWCNVATEEQTARLAAFLVADREQGFDLNTPPLMRMTLVRLGMEHFRWIWSHHHTLLDGWSLPLVLREIFAGYEALRRGEPFPFALPRPYQDYIAWLGWQDLAAAEAFWRRKLAGFNEPTPLSELFGHRSIAEAGRCARHQFILSPKTAAALQALARQSRLTLNTLAQGAWALLLSRYSGQQDVLFGVTVSGRPPELEGVENMVGLFINTLPLRVLVDPTAELLPWLQDLQALQTEARQYEYSPLAQVQGWSEIPRGTALFESLFVFENYPLDALTGQADFSLKVRDASTSEHTNYPLTVIFYPRVLPVLGETLVVEFNYDTGRFAEAAVERLAGHLRTLLEGMAAGGPGVRLGALRLLTPPEEQQLQAWNATTESLPGPHLLPEWFAQQVARAPDASAIVEVTPESGQYLQRVWTYAEMAAWVEELVPHLRAQGVGPEVYVGVYLERSAAFIASALAVLQSGGAYLPLDPQLPRERLTYLLSDAAPAVVLTHTTQQSLLAGYKGKVVYLDALPPTPTAVPTPTLHPEHPAYLIYTSGSTGQPKGVVVTHASICNLVAAQIRAFGLEPGTRVWQFASLNFDASVSEIFTTLSSGGTLYLLHAAEQLLGEELLAALAACAINVVTLPPALLRVLEPVSLPALHTLISAGEACPWEVVERWGAGRRLLNFYGPTEATVGVTYEEVTAATPRVGTVPIGRPIANTQAYVLDATGQPQPVGMPGELVLGGTGVARGYLRRAGLTAERFAPGATGMRWYRTGDRARYLPDGKLEYLGRVDEQVKIRGFRVEPGEVAAKLEQHPAVRTAVVVAQERRPGEVRLVAYFIPTTQPAPTDTALRDFLRLYLPEYMLPSILVPLEDFPMTPSGKIDRAALPCPEEILPHALMPDALPHTEIEQILSEIWRQVLRIETLSIYDNFFDLGGDSIQSIQIAAAAKKVGLHLTTQQIFRHPTISELAEVAGASPAVVAEQGLITGSAPLTPIQHWFFEQPDVALSHWNQAILLETPQPFMPSLLRRALALVVMHHDALRLRFRRGANGWEQYHAAIESDENIPLTVLQLEKLSPEAQCQAIESETACAQISLNLEHGPVLRGVCFDLGPNQPGRFFITIHHLVVDALSWGILMDDLLTVYRQLERHEPATLPLKTTAFRQWGNRLVEVAHSAAILAESDYWLKQAQQAKGHLPVDFAAAPEANSEASAHTLSSKLSVEETHLLLHEMPTLYNTRIDDVLLTAVFQAIQSWSGAQQLWITLEGHGREPLFDDIDVSRTVGWFTTLYPVLLITQEHDDGIEMLKNVKEQLRAVPQRGIGYGVLRYLATDPHAAQLRALPMPEISYNYLGVVPIGELRVAAESPGPAKSPHAQRRHLIEINIQIVAGCLRMDWTYSEAFHQCQTVARLAANTCEALKTLIAHTQTPDAGGYTPSDFEEADLSQEELDWLLEKLGDLV